MAYAAKIDHLDSQNYSNLSVLMTVFQALIPLLRLSRLASLLFEVHFLATSGFVRVGTFVVVFCPLSPIYWLDHAIRVKMQHQGAKVGSVLSNNWTSGVVQACSQPSFISYLLKE